MIAEPGRQVPVARELAITAHELLQQEVLILGVNEEADDDEPAAVGLAVELSQQHDQNMVAPHLRAARQEAL